MAAQVTSGFVFNNAGVAVEGATVELFPRNTTATATTSTTTNSSGFWTMSTSTEGRFDVRITNGTSVRFLKYDDEIQVTTLEVANLNIRNPADTFDYNILPAAIAADRTLTLPLITGTDTLVTLGLAQTFTGALTFAGITLGGAIAGGDQTFTNVGNMTFAAGSILASGSTNGNTLLIRANDTTFITLTTGATDVCTIDGVTASGTWLVSGTWTLPAFTAGGAIDFGNQNMTNVDIDSGTVDGATIGAASATTIVGTTIDATTDFTVGTLILTDDNIAFGGSGTMSLPANNGGALSVTDSSDTWMAFDTRTAGSGVNYIQFIGGAASFASASDSTHNIVRIPGAQWTLTGGTNVTTPIDGVNLNITGINITSVSATTIDQASAFFVSAPLAGGSVSITRRLAAEFDGSALFTNSIWAESTPTEGASGEQLTSGGAGAVITWAAASSKREYKTIGAEFTDTAAALAAMVAAPVFNYTYPRPKYRNVPEVHSDREVFINGAGEPEERIVTHTVMVPTLIGARKRSTGDYETDYVGVMAEDAPWAMHHQGAILNPINTFGYTVLAIKELERRLVAGGL